jgi:hypothetical protein
MGEEEMKSFNYDSTLLETKKIIMEQTETNKLSDNCDAPFIVQNNDLARCKIHHS